MALPNIDHAAVLNSLIDSIIVIDAAGHLLFINSAAANMFRVTGVSQHGQSTDGWLQFVDSDDDEWAIQHDHIQLDQLLQRDDVFIHHASGKQQPVSVTITRLDQADTTAYVYTVQDRTKQHALSNLKSAFVSIVSHQLRTPLSAVKWTLESILLNRRKDPLSEHHKDFLEQALESNERMISLVNDLLNVSQLENGKMKTVPQRVTPATLLHTAVNDIQMYAHANNVTLAIDQTVAGLPDVYADPDQIQQVLQNLLSNSVKYSPGKSVINLGAAVANASVLFHVSDHGIGIPEQAQERLFEPFFRAENAIATKAEGSGLGLYIAKMIVELNGGAISVESQQETAPTGTTFYFSLPQFHGDEAVSTTNPNV